MQLTQTHTNVPEQGFIMHPLYILFHSYLSFISFCNTFIVQLN